MRKLLTSILTLCLIGIIQAQQINLEEIAQKKGITYSFVPDINLDYGLGITFFDVNDDGYDDVLFGGLQEELIHLYIYNHDLDTFEFHDLIGVSNVGFRSKCLLWVDYDNDGDKDLSLTNIEGAPKLFMNQGDFTFKDVSAAAGITDKVINAYSACWGDYDKDGFVDLYIVNRVGLGFNNENFLYRNNGDGTFEDVTLSAGVQDLDGLGLAVSFIDYDRDGWPDIYVANDKFYSPNILYRNLGDGTFQDVSEPNTTGIGMDAMGLGIGDYDHNGYEDIYISNTPSSSPTFGGNAYLSNNGDGTFDEQGETLGLRVFSTSWGNCTADFNNDGHLDIFVSNESFFDEKKINSLFINTGIGEFIEDSLSAIYNFQKNSYGAATGDFNNDGYSDIVVLNEEDNISLYKNQNNDKNWVKINLTGTSSNRDGIGSWIKTYFNGRFTEQYTRCGNSYGSQSSNNYIIGIDTAEHVDLMLIEWPSGIIDSHYNLAMNATYFLEEGIQTPDTSQVDTMTMDTTVVDTMVTDTTIVDTMVNDTMVMDTTDTTTQINNFIYDRELFQVYPNPSASIVTIKNLQELNISAIELINTLGQSVYQNKLLERTALPAIELDLLYYPPGQYFIRIETYQGNYIYPIFKL